MVERHKTSFQLFVSHEEFAKPIEPTVANLNNPAPCFLLGVAPLVVSFLAPINDMRNVAMLGNDLRGWLAAIACICAQMFAAPLGWRLALDHDGFQDLANLADIVFICSGHDDRQRDATPVHQQMSFAAFFSPDPLGWDLQPLAPRVL